MRWQHFLAPHTESIQKDVKSPDYLLSEGTPPSESGLSEKNAIKYMLLAFKESL